MTKLLFAGKHGGYIPSGPTPGLPMMATYSDKLPDPSDDIQWDRNIPAENGWSMHLNDAIGDCTIAGAANFVQTVGSYAGYGNEVIASDAEVLAAYERFGYTPSDPKTDQGVVMSDVLTEWMKNGFTFGGKLDKPLGFVRIDPRNIFNVKQALNMLGPLYVGVNFPTSAERLGPVWRVLPNDPIAGGHCMLAPAWVGSSVRFVTWGAVQEATEAWWHAYVEECWAILHSTWVASGRAPSGFPVDALIADMATLKMNGG